MHLLLAQKGSILESDEAIDLGQSPGDIVFLSAADTELASLAAAYQSFQQGQIKGARQLSLRLANLMQLSHPMSIDLYGEKTLAQAKLIIVRVLGGESYWPYGLEALQRLTKDHNIKLAVLPGDDKADPSLDAYSTLPPDQLRQIWEYLIEGGAENAGNLLRYCAHLQGEGYAPPKAVPLLKAGLWWPGLGVTNLSEIEAAWAAQASSHTTQPIIAISFYRALVQSGNLGPIKALIEALQRRGLRPLPLFVSSLKDEVSQETLRAIFNEAPPTIVLNATGFSVSTPQTAIDMEPHHTVLDETGALVLQIILAGCSNQSWAASSQGLSARDLAMNIALPELDGRVLSRAIAFKNSDHFDDQVETNIVQHQADESRIDYVADLAANWARLQQTEKSTRKIGLILANYPNRDGRIGNGVGLDTPAGTVEILSALQRDGYEIENYPTIGDELIKELLAGPTNQAKEYLGESSPNAGESLSVETYLQHFRELPESLQADVTGRWGAPEKDPFFRAEKDIFALPVKLYGNLAIGIQPARGYNIDPKQSYHCPDLVPPHGYFAFYIWLREVFGTHALIHMGKHGNLEWLPGKALSLSESCYPEAVMGPIPHLYPFIVNDPGEGTQAKRRMSAVIVDHLTPPLTRAESYGPLRDLEALVDEYYDAAGQDPRRLKLLRQDIFNLISDIGLDMDAGIGRSDSDNEKLEKLDAYLCELKELQIRDGLHIFGRAPEGDQQRDLIAALVRVPRGLGKAGDQSLQQALAIDLGFEGFDPLDCDMASPWKGLRPQILADCSNELWRINGDTVERIEILAARLIEGKSAPLESWANTQAVLAEINQKVRPAVQLSAKNEIKGLLRGLDGKFVAPGPSGAPTRGRLDVLPTGRNFFSLDSRAVPTPTAWTLGRKSAELLIKRYRQDHGEWPQAFGLSVWGTSNMRTGGDDIAQALALIGARPRWDQAARRIVGFEIITLTELGRPRIDVTLRISGFFRDAFPTQIDLYDKAVRAIGNLDEEDCDNPIAARMREEKQKLIASGIHEQEADQIAGFRIFGSKPGSYGAGLQALIDEKGWTTSGDLAEAYLQWGSYAYGGKAEGAGHRPAFEARLKKMQAVIHNQDNREHDLLDSDDYYQFEGGMTAAIETVSGSRPAIYHNDHSRPERPVIRALDEEIARVVRGRAINPKWIEGVMRHGYKGAFEMAATVDYLFAFAATTGAVRNHHFEMVYEAYLANPDILQFLKDHNENALKEMAARFLEAEQRGLWHPKSNSANFELTALAGCEHIDAG